MGATKAVVNDRRRDNGIIAGLGEAVREREVQAVTSMGRVRGRWYP